MKFQLTETDRYWWPVTVRVPDPNTAGKVVEQTFNMQFEPVSRDEAIAHEEGYATCKSAAERVSHERNHLMRIAKGWNEDVVGPDNKPVPFTEETFRQALQKSWFRIAVFNAYAESLNGEEARLGN